MIAELAADFWRYLALIELIVLIAAFVALHHGSRDTLRRVTYVTGWGVLYVLAAVAAAVVVNVTTDLPPTPGVKVMVAALAPAAVGAVVAVGWAVRDARTR